MRVGVLVPTGFDEEECYARISAALHLIDSCVPYRARRMRRDVAAILCFGTGADAALGAYVPLFRVCLVDPRHVLNPRTSTLDIARTIIHEATHARLHMSGIRRALKPSERVEAICARAGRDVERKCKQGSM
jgi:hypothetical protein